MMLKRNDLRQYSYHLQIIFREAVTEILHPFLDMKYCRENADRARDATFSEVYPTNIRELKISIIIDVISCHFKWRYQIQVAKISKISKIIGVEPRGEKGSGLPDGKDESTFINAFISKYVMTLLGRHWAVEWRGCLRFIIFVFFFDHFQQSSRGDWKWRDNKYFDFLFLPAMLLR